MQSESDVDWWRASATEGEQFEVIARSLQKASRRTGWPPKLMLYRSNSGGVEVQNRSDVVASKPIGNSDDSLNFKPGGEATYGLLFPRAGPTRADAYCTVNVNVMTAAEVLAAEPFDLNGASAHFPMSPSIAGLESELNFIGDWQVAAPVMSGERVFHQLLGFDQQLAPRDTLIVIHRLARFEAALQKSEGDRGEAPWDRQAVDHAISSLF